MIGAAMADKTAPKQLEPFAFQPGQSGNPAGRPKGARSKLGEAFIEAIAADFAEHGAAAVIEVRETRPADYVKVVASLLPKEFNFDEETLQAMVQVAFIGRRNATDEG